MLLGVLRSCMGPSGKPHLRFRIADSATTAPWRDLWQTSSQGGVPRAWTAITELLPNWHENVSRSERDLSTLVLGIPWRRLREEGTKEPATGYGSSYQPVGQTLEFAFSFFIFLIWCDITIMSVGEEPVRYCGKEDCCVNEVTCLGSSCG